MRKDYDLTEAHRMFMCLGFRKYDFGTSIEYRHREHDVSITFHRYSHVIMLKHINMLTLAELKAINQQCRELKWNFNNVHLGEE